MRENAEESSSFNKMRKERRRARKVKNTPQGIPEGYT
jgi:hypothetical protein